MVAIERDLIACPWKVIFDALHGWLDKEVKFIPYLNNRAFMECEGNEENVRSARVGKFVSHMNGVGFLELER